MGELTEREKNILEKAKEINRPFEWWEIPASPMELSKLIVKGVLKVVGKSYGRNKYVVAEG